MPRLLPLSLFLLVLTAAADAQDVRIDRIEIIEWGIFQNDGVRELASPRTATGTVAPVTNVRHQQVTTTIPALVGMKFGFRFRVVGSPRGANVSLKHVTRFPAQGLTNPTNGKTFASSEYDWDATVGEVSYRGYSLDHEWEVEPGPWTLEIWHQGRKLAEKVFMVTRLVSSVTEVPGFRF